MENKRERNSMTLFQKWIILLIAFFGIASLYFWRSDVEYKRCEDARKPGFGGSVIVYPRDCPRYLFFSPR